METPATTKILISPTAWPTAALLVCELPAVAALPVRVAVRMKLFQEETVAAGTVDVPEVVADP